MKGWRVSCIIPPMAQRNRYRETTGAHTWGCRAAVGMLAGSFLAAAAGGCAPGYVKAADLESAKQGPQHCAARCHELGMEMGALVLVSNMMPGCVCQPRGAVQQPERSAHAAAGITGGAAAHSTIQQQQEQERQRSREQPTPR